MKKESNYSTSLQSLQSIRKQIDDLATTPNKVLEVSKSICQMVKGDDHISIIIALYNKKYLQVLFKVLQTQYHLKKNDQTEKYVALFYVYAYDCFFVHLTQFNLFFEYFKNKIDKIANKKTYRDFGGENKRYQAIRALLLQFAQSNKETKQSYHRGRDINEFIAKHLNASQATSVFQECIYTYIRMQVQQSQAKIVKNLQNQQIGLCCKLHFQERGSQNNVQTRNQNFNKELPSLPSKKILKQQNDCKQLAKKHVVSYLNSTGGIYYFGIEHKLPKQVIFHGLPLNSKIKLDILRWALLEVVMKIYPPDQQNQDDDERKEQQRIQQWKKSRQDSFRKLQFDLNIQYQISKYVFVDFINLYDSNTWLYSRENEEIKYIVRLKTKLGDQYEVYHMINDKDIPQAYIRDDKNWKKLSVIQYYDEVYKRLKDKANQKSKEPPKVHPLCRFPFAKK